MRALIVDDEPLAREGIRNLLNEEGDIEIVGECSDGEEAVEKITELKPDIVFLDVEMPGLDGFGVVERLDPESLPKIVFATAFDEYAVRAFEVRAVDYVLKPFERNRFRAAVARAREQARRDDSGAEDRIISLLNDIRAREDFAERILIKDGGSMTLLRTADIDWIEAAGNYLRIYSGGRRFLMRETMSSMERRLDPREFARIHRSYILNLDRAREIQPWFKGDYVVLLDDGQQLPLSRTYRDRLREQLET